MLNVERLTNMTEGNPVRRAWDMLRYLPGGRRVFSKLIGTVAPYTGTIDGQVIDVGMGYARVRMADRRAVRNHLNCVHAIALINLAEMTTGVAMMYSLPDRTRGILVGLSIEYLHKARGTITGECHCIVPETNARNEYYVVTELKNGDDLVVARAQARWLIGPK